jgi:hypothetical protein
MYRVTRNCIVTAGMMAVASAGMIVATSAGMIIAGKTRTTARTRIEAKVVIAKA